MLEFEFKAADWDEVSLGDVCTIRGGNGFKESHQGELAGDHPFIKVSDLTLPGNEKYISKSNNWVSDAILRELRATLQPAGATVFAKVGAALKLNRRRLLTRPTAIDNNMMAAIPDAQRIIPEFLYYFLLTQDLGRFSQESAVPSINQGHLSSILLGLPKLLEQRKIVQLLCAWDDRIEKTDQLIDAKSRRRDHLRRHFVSWSRWPKVPIGNVLSSISRPVPTPTSAYKALSIRSHGKGTFQRLVDRPEEIDMDTVYEVGPRDLIVNITFAWEGAIALAKDEDAGLYVSHRFPTFQVDEKAINREFLGYAVRSRRFFHFLGVVSPGGAGHNRVLNKSDFLAIEIPLPPKLEQDSAATILLTADREISLLQAERSALATQKRGLMQKLLTGELRVPVDAEVAS